MIIYIYITLATYCSAYTTLFVLFKHSAEALFFNDFFFQIQRGGKPRHALHQHVTRCCALRRHGPYRVPALRP